MTAGTQPFQIKLSSLLIWGLGLFWMLAMLSADFRDPTFFNPLYPAEGLHNWLSLPGALLGGSMIEIFGPVALLIPWLFVRIIIPPSRSTARWLLIYHGSHGPPMTFQPNCADTEAVGPSFSRFFQHLPLLLNQNRKTGKRFQSRDSSIKKGPLVFQTRTSSNGKLNHPLQQTDE